MDQVAELGAVVGLKTDKLTTMKVSIHEDNAGALVLAQTIPPQFTPRSKYYAIKTVWFREEIQKRKIKLLKIDTVQQLGDIFTKGLSDEVAADNIRVMALRPGLIDTEIHAKGGEPGRADRLAHMVPMKRKGSADEVAAPILWLLSDEASYITGSTLDVTGGR